VIDLHTHSYFSDGQDSYEKLIQKANKLELSAFSIADHNYLWQRAQEFVGKSDTVFIPGVEISCVDSETKQTLHLLGYSQHFNVVKLNNALASVVAGYNERAKRIIALVNGRFGTYLVFEQMLSSGPAVFVSRNAIGKELVKEKACATMEEAVRAAFVSDENNDWMPNAGDAIKLVHECGGVAVLAHPGNLFSKLDVPILLKRLADAGLAGIEAYYPKHDVEKTETLLALARQRNLFVTGGSDWHGDRYSHAPMGIDVSPDISKIMNT
jgi:predicted metal-dependent phosphoesterase TrpH